MNHSLTVQLPDEVYQPLLREAVLTGRSLEAVARERLAHAVGLAALESRDQGQSPAEILAEVAALPTCTRDPLSSRDHDRILYDGSDER